MEPWREGKERKREETSEIFLHEEHDDSVYTGIDSFIFQSIKQ